MLWGRDCICPVNVWCLPSSLRHKSLTLLQIIILIIICYIKSTLLPPPSLSLSLPPPLSLSLLHWGSNPGIQAWSMLGEHLSPESPFLGLQWSWLWLGLSADRGHVSSRNNSKTHRSFPVISDSVVSVECIGDGWAPEVYLNPKIALLEAIHWECWKGASEASQDCLLRTCLCEIKIFPTFFNLLNPHFCFKWVNLIITDSLHCAQIQETPHSCPRTKQQYILCLIKIVRNPISSMCAEELTIVSGPLAVWRTQSNCFSIAVTKHQHNGHVTKG